MSLLSSCWVLIGVKVPWLFPTYIYNPYNSNLRKTVLMILLNPSFPTNLLWRFLIHLCWMNLCLCRDVWSERPPGGAAGGWQHCLHSAHRPHAPVQHYPGHPGWRHHRWPAGWCYRSQSGDHQCAGAVRHQGIHYRCMNLLCDFYGLVRKVSWWENVDNSMNNTVCTNLNCPLSWLTGGEYRKPVRLLQQSGSRQWCPHAGRVSLN